ncbi:phage major capsid protein [Clostridium tyrobutyricum]|uniref:phage major capsid protein n=1 Tax=Clostridium tyrobutyricum TaxID=1519 RepID=UPI001C386A56|nr:phage major capsid protein [Clostridium tyrobutyricum]MBV4417465.1 phage major capsid protein [Clostridium tyrobutyricum]
MKSVEIRKAIADKKVEIRSLLDADKIEDAEKATDDKKVLERKLVMVEQLEKEEAAELKRQAEEKEKQERDKENKGTETRETKKNDSMLLRAMVKTMMKKDLSKEERALLANGAGGNGGTPNPWGANGEGYVLPQAISTTINTLIRQYKSFRTVLGHIPTTALTGSFPVEGFDTVTGLVDFSEDGTKDIPESNDIKFVNKKFALVEKGAIIPISNTLLSFTDQALESYIAGIFAKKAVITENAMAVSKLSEGKTVKELADWKALKASINVDLDPAALANACICTNQDGFNVLDSTLDGFGRPILQPNPTNPTQKLFMGIPVNVFSNYMLPSVNTGTTEAPKMQAPIFYGDCMDAVKFVDNGNYSFAVSTEAGFTKNMTYARVIEYIDVVQVDSSDKIYVAGQLPLE